MNYNLAIENIDYNSISKELGIELIDVYNYFNNQNITYKFPIRKLTEEEKNFADACVRLQDYTLIQLLELADDYKIDRKKVEKDIFLIANEMSKINNYKIVKKYFDILIRPYIDHGNSVPMQMFMLSKENILMLLSNVAMGIPLGEFEKIDIKDRMSALKTLLDQIKTDDIQSQLRQINYEEYDKKLQNLTPDELLFAIKALQKKIE